MSPENATRQSIIRQLLTAESATGFFKENHHRIGLDGVELLGCEPAPLKLSKTGGKSVIGFKLHLKDGKSRKTTRDLVAIWRPDDRNQRVFQLLRKLWARGFNGNHRNNVPEPIAYLRNWNLLLVSRASGRELEEILADGNGEVEESIAGAARWLAKLHAQGDFGAPKYSAREDRQVLTVWLRHFKRLHPSLARRVENIVRQIIPVEESSDPASFVLTHGDYHPENIFVGHSQVTTTDFERSAVFDPAWDLGYFAAQVTMKSWNGRYHRSLKNKAGRIRQLFLEEYARRAGNSFAERVPAYEARGYMEILHYVYWGLGVPRDTSDFTHWITRAENVLHG